MASALFSFGNLIAMAGWLGLIVALFVAPVRRPVTGGVRFGVLVLFALAYIALLVLGRDALQGGGLDTIAHVRALFASDNALTAGWLHYLAFDLFVGAWIVEDATTRQVWRLGVVPCLILVFLFGPAGYLLYLALRVLRGQPKAA